MAHGEDKLEQPLQFISLDHPHVVDIVDDGMRIEDNLYVSKHRRAQIVDMLASDANFVRVDGRLMPRWMLAEEPKITQRTSDHAHPPHQYDELYNKYLRHSDGRWRLPDEAWLAERKRRCDALAAKHTGYQQRAIEQKRTELLAKRALEAQLLQAEGAVLTTEPVAMQPPAPSAAPSPGDLPSLDPDPAPAPAESSTSTTKAKVKHG